MHIYFSGIGGAGIGPLAQIAYQAGYTVSGSDKQDSSYITYLRKHGITNIHIGQTDSEIRDLHDGHPIDWFVYTSALPLENPNAPELLFCKEQSIKMSKRDELLNVILKDKGLKLLAVAGTHGKTTTTAITTWLFSELTTPISYLLPAKTSFAEMGAFTPESEYFIYEADEFDRNFLAYEPAISVITGVSWDHHEIFPTREDYQAAFNDFIEQSLHTYVWEEDANYLGLEDRDEVTILDSADEHIGKISLLGQYNRLDAWLAIQAVHQATGAPFDELVAIASRFPGLSRRMELVRPSLYSDYAHTPEKIRGAMSVATEMAAESGQNLVVVYEPLTNRRQHYMLDDYIDCFDGATQLYWIPSYLAREDPGQRIIPPSELIEHLSDPSIATAMERDAALKSAIQKHLDAGDMVVCMAGGGGNSLDDWLHKEFDA
ncbi:MAG: Mur ligase domain-containing protein [Patescibacteria group bacterium]|nr:Mur ligase domain-containing protein [Patescibacteria group bacterium]